MSSNIVDLGPVWFIPGENQGKYPYCHSLFIRDAGIIIDPASDRDTLRHLREEHHIQAVWLSHWHEDHFKDLDLFDDLPLFITRKDAPPLSSLEEFLVAYDSAENSPFWVTVLIEEFHFRPRIPAGYLEPETTVSLPGLNIDIIATPGHTPGHLALFFREPEILFLADYDLTAFGPWYGDRNSSIADTINSLNRLQQIPARIWVTSHEKGIFTSPPEDRWDKYLEVIYERERKLLHALEQPKALEELVEEWIIYGRPREPRAFFAFGERAHLKKHLEDLIKRGLVQKIADRFVLTDGAGQH